MAIALDLIRRICVQECHADLYWWSEVDKIATASDAKEAMNSGMATQEWINLIGNSGRSVKVSERIAFTVLGPAAPQGSMRGYVVKGKARVTCDNSKTIPFRQQIGWTALKARADAGHDTIFAGRHVPVGVSLAFWYIKPPSVSKKRLLMAVKPDLDKLCRSTFDALTGILWQDDAQVVEVSASKHYGAPARTEIAVWKVE